MTESLSSNEMSNDRRDGTSVVGLSIRCLVSAAQLSGPRNQIFIRVYFQEAS